MPSEASGSIQYLVGLTEAIVTLNWSPPENHDRTAIDYYELTLIANADSNTTTTIVYYVGTDSQQSISHKLVVSDRTYMAANITAVDVCGQRSESSHFVLTTIVSESNSSTFLNPANCTILASILSGIALLIIDHYSWW